MSCNYCWNQPKRFGEYDLYLDGKIKANDFVYRVKNKETGKIESLSITEEFDTINERLKTHFTFDTSFKSYNELETAFNNGELKETVIYVVENETSSDNPDSKDNYNEYMIISVENEDGTIVKKLELIGSGSYAKQTTDLYQITGYTGFDSFDTQKQDGKDINSRINKEIADRIADVNAEEKRAIDAEKELDEKINQRVVLNDPITISNSDGTATTSITDTSVSTTTLTGTLDAESMKNSLTAEAVQTVAPIAWGKYTTAPTASDSCSFAIGDNAQAKRMYGVAVGASSIAQYEHDVAIGFNAQTLNSYSTAIGSDVRGNKGRTVSIGAGFPEGSNADGSPKYFSCKTEGTGSITIGAGANTLNNGSVESSNTITIGCKANTTAPNSITLGAGASNTNSSSILIGSSAKSEGDKSLTITLGAQFTETTDAGDVTHPCSTEGTGSITIGAGANTLNPVKVDGTPVLDSEGNPKESSNSVTIGCKALNNAEDNVVIGAQAISNIHGGNVIIGAKAGNNGVGESNGATQCVVIGNEAKSSFSQVVAVGAKSHSGLNSVSLGFLAKAKPNKTIAIGASSAITDTTNADGTITKSENSTVIGWGASASAPNAVVLGAGAKAENEGAIIIGSSTNGGKGGIAIGSQSEVETRRLNWVAIGNGTKIKSNASVVIGHMSRSEEDYTVNIGYNTTAKQLYSIAIGSSSQANAKNSIAIGRRAQSADIGAVVFCSIAEDDTCTQLYFSGQNTPLALKYYPTEWEKKQDVDEQGNPKVDDEGNPIMIDDTDKPSKGQAMMGYVVSKVITNDEGKQETKVLECGTNLLAALFPNHGLGDNPFQPTTTAIDGEEIMSFHPSDLDLPIEEPTDPEDVEINIPEPEVEEYTPLPVYPIVEPEIEEL